jgi:hypothetical protein
MEQEASSQPPLAGDSAFSYWPPQLLLLLLLLLLLPSGQWQRCCFLSSTAPAPSAGLLPTSAREWSWGILQPHRRRRAARGAAAAFRPVLESAHDGHCPSTRQFACGECAGRRRRVARLGLGLLHPLLPLPLLPLLPLLLLLLLLQL